MMKDFPSGIDGLVTLALVLAGAALVLTFVILLASMFNRKRLLKKAWRNISEDEAHALQGQLIDAIKAKSNNQRKRILIGRFWRGKNVPRYVRSALIEQIIDAGIVDPAAKTYTNDFTRFISDAWNDFFCLPPTTLTLSDRDWLLMVHSKMTGFEVLIERMIVKIDSHDTIHKSKNVIRTRDGAVSGVTQAGRDAKVRNGDIAQKSTANDASQLIAIARALRVDAGLAADQRLSARLSTHADLLEQEVDEPESSETRQSLLDRVAGMINKYGDAMATTIRVIGGITRS